MRGDQLARQWRIIRAIEVAKHGLTVAELAAIEEASVRTVYRDLEALHEAGFPIYSEKVDRVNKWFLVDTYSFKVPPPFTLTELMSLWVYKDLIKAFQGTAFYDSLESLFKKVQVTLPPATLAYLDRIQSTFSVGIRPYKEYGQFREILNQVNKAAVEQKSIEIAYTPLRTDQETIRKVDPYKVWFFEGTLYLIGHCYLRDEVRMFVLDRMKLIRVTDDIFEISQDFDLDQFMRHSFKVMHDELETVVVRIFPKWARWAGEKIWHESQKAKILDDGSLELTFTVAGLDEIKRWVLSLGPEATVLRPELLIKLVVQDLAVMRQKYQKSPMLNKLSNF